MSKFSVIGTQSSIRLSLNHFHLFFFLNNFDLIFVNMLEEELVSVLRYFSKTETFLRGFKKCGKYELLRLPFRSGNVNSCLVFKKTYACKVHCPKQLGE